MATGSRVCPHCGGLNGIAEQKCYRCGKSLGALGGGMAALGRSGKALEFPVTKFYLGLCFAVFALCFIQSRDALLSGGLLDIVFRPFPGVVLVRWGALIPGVVEHEPWRLLAAMFVHLNVLHLGFNMMTFVDFGRTIEGYMGAGRYVLLFVVTGVLGFVSSELWYSFTGANYITAGASGGLFGLGGALVGLLYARKDPNYKQVLLRLLVYAAIFALVFSVNNAAHAGGLVTGALLGFLFEKQKRRASSDRVYLALGAALMLLSLASIALSAFSPLSRGLSSGSARAHENCAVLATRRA